MDHMLDIDPQQLIMKRLQTLKILKGDRTVDTNTEFVSIALAFMFEEIRYVLCGTKIDRV